MTVSSTAREAAYAQETAQAFIYLLQIDHSSLSTPIRVALNNEDVVSNGNTFIAYNFEITMPTEKTEEPPTASIRIDNVDRSIIAAIRGIDSPPTASIYIVLVDSPDTIERGPIEMTLRNVTYDYLVIEGSLGAELFLDEKYPYHSFDPNNCPGLF